MARSRFFSGIFVYVPHRRHLRRSEVTFLTSGWRHDTPSSSRRGVSEGSSSGVEKGFSHETILHTVPPAAIACLSPPLPGGAALVTAERRWLRRRGGVRSTLIFRARLRRARTAVSYLPCHPSGPPGRSGYPPVRGGTTHPADRPEPRPARREIPVDGDSPSWRTDSVRSRRTPGRKRRHYYAKRIGPKITGVCETHIL